MCEYFVSELCTAGATGFSRRRGSLFQWEVVDSPWLADALGSFWLKAALESKGAWFLDSTWFTSVLGSACSGDILDSPCEKLAVVGTTTFLSFNSGVFGLPLSTGLWVTTEAGLLALWTLFQTGESCCTLTLWSFETLSLSASLKESLPSSCSPCTGKFRRLLSENSNGLSAAVLCFLLDC